jgi:hypothetical protein
MKRLLFVTLLCTLALSAAWGQAGKLRHQGQFFSAGPGDDVTLTVPAGVVMTDALVTFSVPGAYPNAASLFISDDSGNVLVYELVNNTTFHAGADLQSGIPSAGGLNVTLSCYNISGNHCQGAIMWSGIVPSTPQ